MAKITLEVPDDLARQLQEAGENLPELLRLSLQQPPIPASIYRYIFDFLASDPTPEEIFAFRPTDDMIERLQTLLERERSGRLTRSERSELEEFERIEHFIVLLKTGVLPYVKSTHE